MFTPSEKMYFLLLLLFTILSVITRLHNIEKPTHIWYVTYICIYHNHCVIFIVVLGDHCNFVPDWYALRLTYKLNMCAWTHSYLYNQGWPIVGIFIHLYLHVPTCSQCLPPLITFVCLMFVCEKGYSMQIYVMKFKKKVRYLN